MKTFTVESETACHDCNAIIPEGAEAVKPDSWSDPVCPDCAAKRVEVAAAKRQKENRQGAILHGLLPAIGKAGDIVKIRGGIGEYYSRAIIAHGGKYYRVQVEEIEEEEVNQSY